jgi:hypothetical protein
LSVRKRTTSAERRNAVLFMVLLFGCSDDDL